MAATRFVAVCALLCVACVALAAEATTTRSRARANVIALASGDIDTRVAVSHAAEAPHIRRWMARVASEADVHQYLVQLDFSGGATRRSVEQALGVSLTHYIPHDAFLVAMTSADARRAESIPGVAWVGVHRPQYKASPQLSTFVERVKSAEGIESIRLHGALSPAPAGASVSSESIKRELVAAAERAHLRGLVVRVVRDRKVILELPARDSTGAAGGDASKELYSAAHVEALAAVLAEHPLVRWVTPAPNYTTKNYFARTSIQSGMTGTLPIFNNSITGTGQIIGIGDTGLDTSSCFFYDPNNAVPYDTNSTTHRKLVTYITYSDNIDQYDGHGTHAAGSAAGKVAFQPADVTETTGRFNGMAPDAKIAFTDIQGRNGGLDLPDDLINDYYLPMYYAGARVFSNSWTDDTNSYTTDSQYTDEFMWKYEDALVLFAAGNEAQNVDYPNGYFSVQAPGTAKSIVTVGASQNTRDSFEFVAQMTSVTLTIEMPLDHAATLSAVLSEFSPQPMPMENASAIIMTSPASACTTVTNDLTGAIAIIQRGECAYTTQVMNAQAAGAMAVILVNNVSTATAMTGRENTSWSIPAATISSGDGASLLAYLGMPGNNNGSAMGTVQQGPLVAVTGQDDCLNNIAGWSSRGPTKDLRFKPDLFAPGQPIVSARSNGPDNTNQCGMQWVSPDEGTSTAAPIMAGAATLIRQYFTDGWYPTGYPVPTNTRTPSGALIKAMLINGASVLDGVLSQNPLAPLSQLDGGKVPSIYQGYGRVELDHSMRFVNESTYSLYVADNKNGLNTDAYVHYCFNVPAFGTLKATLAWSDYPSSPEQNQRAANLVNNLDLSISSGSSVWIGNNIRGAWGTGATTPFWDTRNNVETVEIKNAVAGLYTINVNAIKVLDEQPYALVVTGDFVRINCDQNVQLPCPGGCSNQGGCDKEYGVCGCSDGIGGADCSQGSTPIDDGATVTGTVWGMGWQYFSVQTNSLTTSVVFTITRTSGQGTDADYYIDYKDAPTLTSYNQADTSNDDSRPSISITIDSPIGGSYVLGMFGYYPGKTTATISATVTQKPSAGVALVASPLLALLVALFALFMF